MRECVSGGKDESVIDGLVTTECRWVYTDWVSMILLIQVAEQTIWLVSPLLKHNWQVNNQGNCQITETPQESAMGGPKNLGPKQRQYLQESNRPYDLTYLCWYSFCMFFPIPHIALFVPSILLIPNAHCWLGNESKWIVPAFYLVIQGDKVIYRSAIYRSAIYTAVSIYTGPTLCPSIRIISLKILPLTYILEISYSNQSSLHPTGLWDVKGKQNSGGRNLYKLPGHSTGDQDWTWVSEAMRQ